MSISNAGINRRPSHPGEMLREDFLPDYGLTVAVLAEAIGVSRQSVNELLRERRAVSPDMALRLARLFGNTPEFWLNAQRPWISGTPRGPSRRTCRESSHSVPHDIPLEVSPPVIAGRQSTEVELLVVLRATRKVLKSLPQIERDGVASDNALGDWYVNRLVIDRRPLLLLVSSASRLAIVTPAREVKTLPDRLATIVGAASPAPWCQRGCHCLRGRSDNPCVRRQDG